MAVVMMVWHGAATIVFRHAFGIELPDPFGRPGVGDIKRILGSDMCLLLDQDARQLVTLKLLPDVGQDALHRSAGDPQ